MKSSQRQEFKEQNDQNYHSLTVEDAHDFILKPTCPFILADEEEQKQHAEDQKQESMKQKDEVDVHPLVLNFLGNDNSFLSPWSWDPQAWNNTETTSSSRSWNTEIKQFQEGSFFAIEVFDFVKPKELPRNSRCLPSKTLILDPLQNKDFGRRSPPLPSLH